MNDETRARKRCTSCRRWFEPAASALHNQKTCGAVECRLRRRSKAARQRRELDVQDFRVEERARQLRFRDKRRKKGVRGDLSRAGLPPQVKHLEQVVLEKWDKLARVSRAGLRREIRVALGRTSEIVGQESAVP